MSSGIGNGGTTAKQVLQHPRSYEAAVQRHGQYVLWYSAQPCFCLDNNGMPEENHARCQGRGTVYSLAQSVRILEERMGQESNKFNTLGVIDEVLRVFKARSTDLTVQSVVGSTITLASVVHKHERVTIDYMQNTTQTYSGVASWEGKGLIRIPLTTITQQGRFNGTIIAVTSLTNVTQSKSMKVEAVWEDLILTSDAVNNGDVLSVVCSYVNPLRFLITGLNPMQNIQNTLMGDKIDGSMTFPSSYQVGAGDIITLIRAETRAAFVGDVRSDSAADNYRMPFFHVAKILRVEDNDGVVVGGTVVRNNEIAWNGPRRPHGKFSIQILYHPSFLVQVPLPNLRFAEDKVFPRKVALKRWDQWLGRNEVRPSVRDSQGKFGAVDILASPSRGADRF